MYFFYVDETGNRDPRLEIPRKDGTSQQGDHIYVLTAVSLFERQWHGFDKTLNRFKQRLGRNVYHRSDIKLELADCEIKSNWIRQPKARASSPFLAHLTAEELTGLAGMFYRQLAHHNMDIFSIIIDKRHLYDYFDQEKLHRKSWELLLEQIERYMRFRHSRHQALMVNDDVSKQVNRSLAMKHVHMLDEGTSQNTWLKHICEMPMFVRSELSNGIQLADLCSYNIYRAFKHEDLNYPFFQQIAPHIWSRTNPVRHPFSGLYVFPGKSPLRALVDEFEKKRARTGEGTGS